MMRKRAITLKIQVFVVATLAMLAVLMTSAMLAAAADEGKISGVVKDPAGAVVVRVKVTAVNTATNASKETVTDAKGEYSFTNLGPGTYRVTADLPGFQTARYSNVALADKQSVQYDFAMSIGAVTAPVELVKVDAADNGSINGVVTDNSNARLPGTRVTAINTGTGASRDTVTNGSGAYTFSNLTPGTYSLAAELAGFTAVRISNVTLPNKQSIQQDFRLPVLRADSVRQQNSVGVPPPPPPPAPVLAPTAPPPSARTAPGAAGGIAPGAGAAGRGGAAGAGGGRGAGGGGGTVVGGINSSASLSALPSVVYIGPDRSSRPIASNNEAYNRITDNPFIPVGQESLSTFAIDVDTASYSNVRRFLTSNQTPPKDAVRIEELINYFAFDYPQASGADPITGNIEAAAAPWNPQHRLVRIGIKAKDVRMGLKPANYVFLIDVSGSMSTPERLPLLKSGLHMLVDKLTENDKVTIVTYAGASGLALPPTTGDRKSEILRVIDNLQAEGSTNGGAGIQLAYDQATASFIRGGVNRVILATDGDFNVGITSQTDLIRLIQDRASSGVFLSTLGFGTNNLKDAMLEQLADKGNGNYAYIDTLNEARKVLVDHMASTLVTVAKDVKIQVEFNPALVDAYRLIGYENRALRAEDFNNDNKDAGEMGAGHTVTALYEVVPRGTPFDASGVFAKIADDAPPLDPLRYAPLKDRPQTSSATSNELLDLKIRYKEPDGTMSKLLEVPLVDRSGAFTTATNDFRFAAAVAAFGMILRDSPYKGSSNWEMVRSIAMGAMGADRFGYREEFIQLVNRASQTWRR